MSKIVTQKEIIIDFHVILFDIFDPDIPSTPRDVWVNNVDFQTQIHWTSPKHSGHLPLRYVVKAQCKNETIPDIPHCQSDFFIVCDNSNSHLVTRSYPLKWSCEAEGGLLFPFYYVVYKLFVEVSNYLGSNQSKAVVVKANMINPLLSMTCSTQFFIYLSPPNLKIFFQRIVSLHLLKCIALIFFPNFFCICDVKSEILQTLGFAL